MLLQASLEYSWLPGWSTGACFVLGLRQDLTLALGMAGIHTVVLAGLELMENHLLLSTGVTGVSPHPAVMNILWCTHSISLGYILAVALLAPRRHVIFIHSFSPY